MSIIKLMIVIIKRESEESYERFFEDNGVVSVFSTLCNGTAQKKLLDYLGIEKTEKVMLQTMVSENISKQLIRGMIREMGIEVPGNGIVITMPVSSIGGTAGMQYLTESQDISAGEVKQMSEAQYSVIIAIADKGNSGLVMDAARSAGAAGGTVVHAKGTGTEFTSRFFGVSIAAEKEMIYIVTKKCDKNNIMKAVIEQAGINSEAHAVVFTLPVDSVAGLRSVED